MSRPSKKLAELPPGAKVSGVVHECEHCGVRFLGRSHAKYCSDKCRYGADYLRRKDDVEEA